MNVREASDDDVEAIAGLVAVDLDAARLLRERMVLVAERDGDVVGFLSFDVRAETVHVSTMVGDSPVVDELLEPVRRFADSEGMPVEIVVPDADEELQAIVTEAGFESVGRGPLFDGSPSRRYRYND